MISADNISVSFGSFKLISNISFLINTRDRIGLTGKNGAGKTTLLKVIHGIHNPGSGEISGPGKGETGYLPQQMSVANTATVLEETLTAFAHLQKIENKIKIITEDISARDDYNSKLYLDLCDKLNDLQEELRINGGDQYLPEAEQALSGLGFERSEFNKPTGELSGGWRMRIELAKLLLSKPSLLLLDEPTNHLDILSIQWLENYLKVYPGAVMLVSHDRAFLDNVCKRTIELSLGKAYDYKVPYSKYVELRKERREQQMAAYRNQQKMIGDTERFIERFRYKNTKAIQVQSRIKKLDKLDRIELEEEDLSAISIKFAPSPRSGTIVVEAEGLSKSYGSHEVLEKIDIIIERGEKIAFVGRNGEGKTSFSRVVTGELEYTGKLKLGHNTNIGYFAQNQDELLNNSDTVFETIDNIAKGEIRTKIRGILGAFLFSGDDIDKKVKVLSGGERSRLALVKLLLEPYNLLVLDEPTNHLDMHSKEILKQALLKYDGTLIVVSHDRDFLDGLVDKIYEFRNKGIKENIGGIYSFLEKKKLEDLQKTNKKDKIRNLSTNNKLSNNKQEYHNRKNYEKQLRKLRKILNNNEEEVECLEKRKAEMDIMLNVSGNEEIAVDNGFYKEYEELNISLNTKMKEWENISSEIERFLKNDYAKD